MQIQLLIPGLLWPVVTLLGPASGLGLGGLASLPGRGRRQVTAFEPYDRQLARLFGVHGDTLPMASLRRLGEADAPTPEQAGHWLCADPVNLSFAREHLLLQAFRMRSWTQRRAPSWSPSSTPSSPISAASKPARPRWYLRLHRPTAVTLYPLDDVTGRPVKHFLPEGDDARLWQRTMNEAQIVLHNHARSRAREEAGRRAVNSVWLWGAGALDAPPQAPARQVQATDQHRCLARAAGVAVGAPDPGSALTQDTLVVLDALRKPAQQLDLDTWRRGLETLERDWLAPLAEAFRAGRLDTVRLTAPGDRGTLQLELHRSERWKFWRKPYAFDALLKSIAPAPMQTPHRPGPTDALRVGAAGAANTAVQ